MSSHPVTEQSLRRLECTAPDRGHTSDPAHVSFFKNEDLAMIAQSGEKEPSLFTLPLELRQTIYNLVFKSCPNLGLNLLCTCKHIYSESEPIFYKIHKTDNFDFVIKDKWPPPRTDVIRAFLNAPRKVHDGLQNIRLEIHVPHRPFFATYPPLPSNYLLCEYISPEQELDEFELFKFLDEDSNVKRQNAILECYIANPSVLENTQLEEKIHGLRCFERVELRYCVSRHSNRPSIMSPSFYNSEFFAVVERILGPPREEGFQIHRSFRLSYRPRRHRDRLAAAQQSRVMEMMSNCNLSQPSETVSIFIFLVLISIVFILTPS